jgi:hypothetical protein
MPEGQKERVKQCAAAIIDAIPEALGMTPDPWPTDGPSYDGEPHKTVERLLALLLAEAQRQDQEKKEVTTRVDGQTVMPLERATAALNETKEATVTPNHVTNEPQAWRDIASAPADGTWVLGFDAEEMPQQEVVRWTEDIHGNTATWRCSEDYVRSPTHWMPLLAALPETSAQPQEENQKNDDQARGDHSQYDPPSAGPLATAATNEPVPTTEGPPWWCDTCQSWRYTQPCGRDQCPTPREVTNG